MLRWHIVTWTASADYSTSIYSVIMGVKTSTRKTKLLIFRVDKLQETLDGATFSLWFHRSPCLVAQYCFFNFLLILLISDVWHSKDWQANRVVRLVSRAFRAALSMENVYRFGFSTDEWTVTLIPESWTQWYDCFLSVYHFAPYLRNRAFY